MAGLQEDQIGLIQDLYEDSATTIRHDGGVTNPIKFQAGVRQGCPLSPILFNLVMEFLIRPITNLAPIHGANLHGSAIGVLAYADDLALIARSEESLNALLQAVTPAAEWVGLRFKHTKCATLHISHRAVRPTSFTIYGTPMQALKEGEPYSHLGVPTGMHVYQTPTATITRLEREATAIFSSLLAPGKNSTRCGRSSSRSWNLATARVRKSTLTRLDKILRDGCKDVMGLPQRACAALVFIPPAPNTHT